LVNIFVPSVRTINRFPGAPTLAHEHYKGLRIKQTQHDTLSYLVLARASTFCMAGDSELVGECIESSQIYTANVQETPELVARAFVGEKFAQVRIKHADGRCLNDNLGDPDSKFCRV
jgi:hypothetical protein